jgi:CheY-like chemotaxis protein
MEVSVSPVSRPAGAVLVVDESIATRAPLAELLRSTGHFVLEAASSDDALDLLNSRLEIDVLIAHEQAPGAMGGLALADWVGKTRPTMRVIVLSDQVPTLDELCESLVFVVRPFPAATLLAMLPPAGPRP